MTVTLNEGAIRFMLEDPIGPVGRMLQRTADVIAGNEEAIINLIFVNPVIRPRVVDQVIVGDDGLVAVIDVPFEGRVSDYFAQKMGREDWIVPAIMQNWDSQI